MAVWGFMTLCLTSRTLGRGVRMWGATGISGSGLKVLIRRA